MRAYCEDFPADATLGLVFRDLHAKANLQVGDLDRLVNNGEESTGRAPVPGVPLLINWNELDGGRGDYSYLTHIVQLQLGTNLRPLTEVSSYLPKPDGVWEASRVGGNRDYDSWGEASMSRQEGHHASQDMIIVRLGESGIRGSVDFAGVTRARAEARLDELPEDDLCRVELTAQSILSDIAVIKLILDGTAPEEALRKIDSQSLAAA